jgi:molecular chaperone DnaK
VGYRLGVDLGTTFTAAATSRDGRPEVVTLGDRADLIPSVVFVGDDGTVLIGDTADRRALTEPGRVAREFKRRLGDPTPLIVGGSPYSAEALMAMLLRWVLDKVSRLEGGPPDQVTVTHPATWGPYRMELLGQALRRAGLGNARTLPEPEAAAIYYASKGSLGEQAVFAVYDLGGGTFDATVLERDGAEFRIRGTPEGIDQLGGIDFDEAVVAHVRRSLGTALDGPRVDDPAMLAVLAQLRRGCVEAKEALSSDSAVVIPVLLPSVHSQVRLTRAELEAMIRPPLGETIAALHRALDSAEVEPSELSAVLLVGGSSRIPLVAEMLNAELGRPVVADAHPKYAIVLGAAMAAGAAEAAAAEDLLVKLDPDPSPTPPPPPVPTPPVPVPVGGNGHSAPTPPTTPTPPPPFPDPVPARRPPPRWWAWAVTLLGLVALVAVLVARLGGADPGGGTGTSVTSGPSTTLGPRIEPLPERITAAGEIVVGSIAAFGSSGDPLSPILFEDPATDQLTGFDYQLAQAIGEKLDIEVRFQVLDHFTHSFSDLTAKKIDLSMSVLRDRGVSRNREDVDFIDYLDPGTVLLVPAGTKDQFRSAGDLCGKTIARPQETPAGSILADSARCTDQGRPPIRLMTCPPVGATPATEYKDVTLVHCPEGENPLRLLAAGRLGVDAAMLDTPMAARAMQRTPAFKEQLETAPVDLEGGPYGIAVRRSDRQLRGAVQSALRAVIADGTYDKLIVRWKLTGQALKTAAINSGS